MERSTNTLALRRQLLTDRSVPRLGHASHLLDDLKLFAAAWIGGLVFFGTFIA